jgi:gamma-glutamylcyclotransferase (GGCT)/AIG2-like uncharacterized protein YtfP
MQQTQVQKLSANTLALLQEFRQDARAAREYALAKARWDKTNALAYEFAAKELEKLIRE